MDQIAAAEVDQLQPGADMLDDEPFRAFDKMADYRAWCQSALPSWLGYGRV
jgi:hypothetical protein